MKCPNCQTVLLENHKFRTVGRKPLQAEVVYSRHTMLIHLVTANIPQYVEDKVRLNQPE